MAVELPFYRLVHVKGCYPAEIARLRALIDKGVRSPDWSLDRDLEIAKATKHPNLDLLTALAAVISGGRDPAELGRFSEWNGTSPAPPDASSLTN